MIRIVRIRDKGNAVYQCQLNSVNGSLIDRGQDNNVRGEKSKIEIKKNVHESKVEKMNADVVETASRVESYIEIEAGESQD